jgi:cytochrome c oxidase assembly protein subunit 19
MVIYLACMKSARSLNDACREQAKTYLQCRMDRNLMAPDSMKNLGFHQVEEKTNGDGTTQKQDG